MSFFDLDLIYVSSLIIIRFFESPVFVFDGGLSLLLGNIGIILARMSWVILIAQNYVNARKFTPKLM